LLSFFICVKDKHMDITKELLDFVFHLDYSIGIKISDTTILGDFIEESILDQLNFNAELLSKIQWFKIDNDINILFKIEDQDYNEFDLQIIADRTGSIYFAEVSNADGGNDQQFKF